MDAGSNLTQRKPAPSTAAPRSQATLCHSFDLSKTLAPQRLADNPPRVIRLREAQLRGEWEGEGQGEGGYEGMLRDVARALQENNRFVCMCV